MKQLVQDVRASSRNIVRELGFLDYQTRFHGLTPAQLHGLIEIDKNSPISILALGAKLLLDKTTISKMLKTMEKYGWVEFKINPKDSRSKLVILTEEGQDLLKLADESANSRVLSALTGLSPQERNSVIEGMNLYSKALASSRLKDPYKIRTLQETDNLGLAQLIRNCLTEIGANGPGFAYSDPSLNNMYDFYNNSDSAYFVVEKAGQIHGGAGIAPLDGVEYTCELQKMYLDYSLRGLGFGKDLMLICQQQARELGYRFCYIETLDSMKSANQLYQKFGFKPLVAPLGDTGHYSCNKWYLLELTS